MQNLRYALRGLAKSPGFALTAILTLGAGIGASTAIFTTVDAVLLHPLHYPDPAQLIQVTKNMPKFELFKSDASALDFLDYRGLSRSFSHHRPVLPPGRGTTRQRPPSGRCARDRPQSADL
jgi:hypothetical protein